MKEQFLKDLAEMDNFTETENGAVALNSTNSNLLDAFGTLGGMRNWDDSYIIDKFAKAFAEDKVNAIKMLFYFRDIRGGQGERKIFRVIMKWLANNYPDYVKNNLDNFLFYGRGDDLFTLVDTPVEDDMIKYVRKVLNEDIKAVTNGGHGTLMAKWMPSVNTSSKKTVKLAKHLIKKIGCSERDYRKSLAFLRKDIGIVESMMSQDRWDEIEFDKLPSRAALIYRDAFYKHLTDKYSQYLINLSTGDAKVNANALFPVDIIAKINIRNCKPVDRMLYDAMWKALPDYFTEAGKEETGICVVDTSGSMMGTPLNVALSLGLYCADKCKGPFKDHFFTFSSNPKLQKIVGNDIFEKVVSMVTDDWEMNTNLEAVFDLILQTALANNTPQEDLPAKLYIISDMQFDEATTYGNNYWCSASQKFNKPETFIDSMKAKYAEHGYTLPAIVYWNVNTSDCGMFQQKVGDEDCCMVSGYSPSLFKSIILGTEFVEEVTETGEKVVKQKLDPVTIMMKTLNDERYDRVWVG